MDRHAGQPIRAASWPARAAAQDPAGFTRDEAARRQAKFEVYGEEMIEKEVRQSGSSGRIYLPQEWVGKSVKVIRLR